MNETENNSTAVASAQPAVLQRRLVLGAVGTAAALGGVGFAWLHYGQDMDAGGDPLPSGFWEQQWDAPQGESVLLQSFRGKPLLLNFWATWCAPCVEEMPSINDLFLQNRANGLQVLGLAIDKPASVVAFLQRMAIAYPIGMAGANGTQWAAQLGNPSGALPYSLLVSGEGLIVRRKLGKLSAADLTAWARVK